MTNTIPHNSFLTDMFLPEEDATWLILHNTQASYVLLDRGLSVVYFNKAAREAILRFLNIDMSKGLHMLSLVQEERKPFVIKLCTQVLAGQTQITESPFSMPDGSELVFENIFSPAFDEEGKVVGIIVTSKDVTEKRRAQKSIRESEERLQFALEAAHQGAWDWNLQTNEVTYSSSYKKLYGFAENELHSPRRPEKNA
jgi:PAS domain S-box-containing protein